jgi:hypothetical protein
VRRAALSLALIAAGAAMFTAAAWPRGVVKSGGIFRAGTTGASVQLDPQLGYVTTAWWLEYATAAKLFDFPDRPGAGGTCSSPRSHPDSLSRATAAPGDSRFAAASASATARP